MLDTCNIFVNFNILILIIFLIILKYLIEKLLIFFKVETILNYNLLTGTTWDDNTCDDN